MKRSLLLAAALSLTLPAFSMADARDNDDQGRGRGHEQQHGNRNARAEHGFKENRGFEKHGYQRVANGRKFKYKGRSYSAVYAPAFAYPRGYAYRHWTRGATLPAVFIAEPFFIDYAWIGLLPPPPAYEWVRYGPDGLLVNIYDGRIVD